MCLLGRFFCLYRLMTRFGSHSACWTPADFCLCRAVRKANFEHISWHNLTRVQSQCPARVQITTNWPLHKILLSLIWRQKIFLLQEVHSEYPGHRQRSLWASGTAPDTSSSCDRVHSLQTRSICFSLSCHVMKECSCSIFEEKKQYFIRKFIAPLIGTLKTLQVFLK